MALEAFTPNLIGVNASLILVKPNKAFVFLLLFSGGLTAKNAVAY